MMPQGHTVPTQSSQAQITPSGAVNVPSVQMNSNNGVPRHHRILTSKQLSKFTQPNKVS